MERERGIANGLSQQPASSPRVLIEGSYANNVYCLLSGEFGYGIMSQFFAVLRIL